MSTQFLVRSDSNGHPLKLRTVLYDGLELRRTFENGVAVFEVSDSDVVIELVIRRNVGSIVDRDAGYKSIAAPVAEEKTADEPEDNVAQVTQLTVNNKTAAALQKIQSIKGSSMSSLEKEYYRHQQRIEARSGEAKGARASEKNSSARTPSKIHEETWEQRFNELMEHKRLHGNCKVSRSRGKKNSLAIWVDEQRKKYRKGTLRDDYLRRLNQIDFTWNAWESLWNLRYSQLIMFKREFGHCRVPQKYEKNPQLGESKEGLIRDFVYLMNLINFFRFRLSGEWVMEQRGRFRRGRLVEERMAKLNELNFTWDGKMPAAGQRGRESAQENSFDESDNDGI